MRPIVNGLENEFGDAVTFLYTDAADNADGQQAFNQLALPGHPSFVIFDPEGGESYRTFGVVNEETLDSAIRAALAAR